MSLGVAVLESGTYSARVAEKLFPDGDFMNCSDNCLVAINVEWQRCRAGVIAMMNSTVGAVSESQAILSQWPVKYPDRVLQIYLQTAPKINHSLLGLAGTRLSQVEAVLGHPQALCQVRDRIHALLPNADLRPKANTGMAIREITTNTVAVGPAKAANGNIVVLATDLQPEENATTFIVFGEKGLELKMPSTNVVGYRAVAILDIVNRQSALCEALQYFDLDMSALPQASHPTRPGDKLFWAEFVLPGHDLKAELSGLEQSVRTAEADGVLHQGYLLGYHPVVELTI